jgi:uncharacterized damage-inducible protein DinB
MMKRLHYTVVASALFAAFSLLPSPASAQAPEGLMGELQKDLAQVEKKVLGLARAIPESAYAWRPAEGVRSTGEVFQHIAADNYFLPVLAGTPAPAQTGITNDYKTTQAFEKKPMSRDAVIAEVEKSFAFLRTAMNANASKLDAPIDMFGQKTTTRGLWITTLTHLHEHLGQLIAYARSNNVVPPWSK